MTESQHSVLIVDDNKELVAVLKDKFEIEGFATFVAHDGEAGLKAALENHPDIILLDVMMPKKDGWEVIAGLHEDDWGKEAKIILLTSLNDMDSISKAVEAGNFEYLVKTDWEPGEIVQRVKETLEK